MCACMCVCGHAYCLLLYLWSQMRRSQINMESTRNLLMGFLWVLKNADHACLRHWWVDLPMAKLSRILEILYLAVSNFEYKVWQFVACSRLFVFAILLAVRCYVKILFCFFFGNPDSSCFIRWTISQISMQNKFNADLPLPTHCITKASQINTFMQIIKCTKIQIL